MPHGSADGFPSAPPLLAMSRVQVLRDWAILLQLDLHLSSTNADLRTLGAHQVLYCRQVVIDNSVGDFELSKAKGPVSILNRWACAVKLVVGDILFTRHLDSWDALFPHSVLHPQISDFKMSDAFQRLCVTRFFDKRRHRPRVGCCCIRNVRATC